MAAASDVIRNFSTKVQFVAVNDRATAPADSTLLELAGANTANEESGIQTVDISSFGDGLRMPKAKVALDGNFSINGVVTTTPAFTAFKSLADGADVDKECYLLITSGDGSQKAVYGIITNYSQARDQRDVMRFTSTVNVQSDITYTAAP